MKNYSKEQKKNTVTAAYDILCGAVSECANPAVIVIVNDGETTEVRCKGARGSVEATLAEFFVSSKETCSATASALHNVFVHAHNLIHGEGSPEQNDEAKK